MLAKEAHMPTLLICRVILAKRANALDVHIVFEI